MFPVLGRAGLTAVAEYKTREDDRPQTRVLGCLRQNPILSPELVIYSTI